MQGAGDEKATTFFLSSLCSLCLCGESSTPARAEDEGRSKVRILYDFEEPADAQKLMNAGERHAHSGGRAGASRRRALARLTARKGVDYAVVLLDNDAIKGWGDYDYFAIDVTLDDDHPYALRWSCGTAPARTFATRGPEERDHAAGPADALYPSPAPAATAKKVWNGAISNPRTRSTATP